MPAYTNPLEQVKVAAPCPADWEKMVGDERVRYCDRCSLHVYNLSGMTRREAEGLVTSAEGRLCVRFYRRPDGTILTRNCPVGLSALKRRAAHAATATLTAVLGFFTGLGLNFGLDRALSPSIMEASAVPAPPMPEGQKGAPAAVKEVEVTLGEMVPRVKMGRVVVGDVYVPEYEHQLEDPAARGQRQARRQR
jgi:hypothetical protein